MSIKVLYFSSIKDLLKQKQQFIKIDKIKINTHNDSSSTYVSNYEKVFNAIIEENINYKKEIETLLTNCLIAIDDDYVKRNSEFSFQISSEISIIPPISGG